MKEFVAKHALDEKWGRLNISYYVDTENHTLYTVNMKVYMY